MAVDLTPGGKVRSMSTKLRQLEDENELLTLELTRKDDTLEVAYMELHRLDERLRHYEDALKQIVASSGIGAQQVAQDALGLAGS